MAIADCHGLPLTAHVTSASPHKVTMVEETLQASFVPLQTPLESKTNLCRALRQVICYEYSTRNFLGMVHIGRILILLRHL